MKRVLSLVLVLMLVLTSIVPAFAEEATNSEAGQELYDFGLIAGDGVDLNEAAPLKRSEMAVILAKMYGDDDIAIDYQLPTTLTDVADMWYTPWANYAFATGRMVGNGTDTFSPDGFVTAKQIKTLMLEALGYTVVWETVDAQAAEAGIVVTAADATQVARKEIFASVRAALDLTPMGAEMTLGSKLELVGYVAPVVPTTEVLVDSITMTNYKTADIMFNTTLDEDTVILANFVSSDDDNSIASVSLSEDMMSVEVTLVDGEELAAYGSLEVTINDVKSVAGEEVAEDTVVEVEFVVDLAVPTVVSVEAVGNSGVKVQYSEAIQDTHSITNYYLNGKLFAGSETVSGDMSTLSLTKRLDAGVHSLTIREGKISDFANLDVVEVVVEFVVEEDATAPMGDVKSVTQTEVVIEFTEAIDSVTVSSAVGSPTEAWNTDMTELTLTYTTSVPVPVNGTTITLTDLTDAFGNVTEELELSTGFPTVDLVRPEITEVTVEDQDYILVSFSEDVVITGATFTLKDADGDVAEVLTAVIYTDDDSVVHNDMVKLTGTLAPATYTLVVEDVVDASPLANGMVPTIPTVVVLDATAPTVDEVTRDANTLFVVFDEKVAVATATDKANYSYNVGINGKAFAATETFTLLDDGMTVMIAFTDLADDADAPQASTVTSVQVSAVTDVALNTMITSAHTIAAFVEVAPVVNSAAVTGENTVVLSLTGDVVDTTIAPTDFVIVASGTTISVLDTVYDADDATITLTINADLDANGQYNADDLVVTMTTGTVQTANVYGQKISVAGPITATEEILPTVVMDDIAAGTTATLTFSENIVLGADNFIVYVDGVATTAYSTNVTDAVLTFTFVTALEADEVVRVLYYGGSIVDGAGNAAANFDLTTTVE